VGVLILFFAFFFIVGEAGGWEGGGEGVRWMGLWFLLERENEGIVGLWKGMYACLEKDPWRKTTMASRL